MAGVNLQESEAIRIAFLNLPGEIQDARELNRFAIWQFER